MDLPGIRGTYTLVLVNNKSLQKQPKSITLLSVRITSLIVKDGKGDMIPYGEKADGTHDKEAHDDGD